ncbi:MAG: response regulator [Pseudomonadota bacterium]
MIGNDREPNLDLPVLLIDDDAMVRDVVAQYLESYGFTRVRQMGDPTKALKYLNDPLNPVGLIISDWEMPGVNGLTLLKAVRNHPIRKKVPFVMITSQRSMERFKVTQAAQMRVSSYVVKPFRAETLKNKIWEILGWDELEKNKKPA